MFFNKPIQDDRYEKTTTLISKSNNLVDIHNRIWIPRKNACKASNDILFSFSNFSSKKTISFVFDVLTPPQNFKRDPRPFLFASAPKERYGELVEPKLKEKVILYPKGWEKNPSSAVLEIIITEISILTEKGKSETSQTRSSQLTGSRENTNSRYLIHGDGQFLDGNMGQAVAVSNEIFQDSKKSQPVKTFFF